MSKYNRFWDSKLNVLKSLNINTKNYEIAAVELKTIGDRNSTGYNGYLDLFAGKVEKMRESAVFRSLKVLIENKYKSSFHGYVTFRIKDNDTLVFNSRQISFKDIIERYSKIENEELLLKEIYKWELIKKFQDNWQSYRNGQQNFVEMWNKIEFKNLVYPTANSVFKQMTTEAPAALERLVNELLFNETLDLENRILQYRQQFQEIYASLPSYKSNNGTYQDERTLGTLLAFMFPEKYTFFKDSLYTPLCKNMGVEPKKPMEKIFHYYSLVEDMVSNYLPNFTKVISRKNKLLSENSYRDESNRILAQDILYLIMDKGEIPIEENENEVTMESNKLNIEKQKTMINSNLNQILYGPPGTGKTYNTINIALKILNPNIDLLADREELKKHFDKYIEDGQIVFTTFHQSMSYEDFIEGIKPTRPEEGDEFIKYEVEPGIFKLICERAKKISFINKNINWDKPDYYKMSLGGKNKPDLHEWCIENDLIALGWGGNKDLSKFIDIKDWNKFRDTFSKEFPELVKESRFNIQAAYSFLNMKENDIVIISRGNRIIDAIGIVNGPYYWDDKNPVDFCHFRKVEWIVKDLNTLPERFFSKQISQMTIYKFYTKDVKKEAFKELNKSSNKDDEKPYVLIIDEINRGNVSQIFGELITLIEADKRAGKSEALEVILPYSKSKFSVPQNLYIIGTMNTADRSVEALDTALRRRFSFIEMPPKPELITPSETHRRFWMKNIGVYGGDIEEYNEYEKEIREVLGMEISDPQKYLDYGENEHSNLSEKDHQIKLEEMASFNGINFSKILEIINFRIEKLSGKDHQIGHSYFMNVYSIFELKSVFQNNIIPLLQEYFYGDYGKIGLVLGESFFSKIEDKEVKNIFAKFGEYEGQNIAEKPTYNLKNVLEMEDVDFKRAIEKLLEVGS
jgi:hypothetical protein